MDFFRDVMESTLSSINIRRSGPDDDKQTYMDLTVLVEVPHPDVVLAIDEALHAALFGAGRTAVKSSAPSSSIHFPPQDLALATCLFEDRSDNDVMLYVDGVTVKVKKLFPANEDSREAQIQLMFSFTVPDKRTIGLLAEQHGEAIWFHGKDSILLDEPKKKKVADGHVAPLPGQLGLTPDTPDIPLKSV